MVLPDMYRAPHPLMEVTPGDTTGGYFVIQHPTLRRYTIRCLAANELWQRVAVIVGKVETKPTRCPTCDEMCIVKDLFWNKDETVIQYHPCEEDYINNHPYCLWLWRHNDYDFPSPPSYLVGVK